MTPVALLVVATLAVCVTPAALSDARFAPLYLVPVALAYWILRVRTSVDAEQLRVRTLFGSRQVAWDDVTSVRVPGPRAWVRLVLATPGEQPDTEVALPNVRVRDLPLLAELSGGRFADPLAMPEGEHATQDAGEEVSAEASDDESGAAQAAAQESAQEHTEPTSAAQPDESASTPADADKADTDTATAERSDGAASATPNEADDTIHPRT